MGTLPSSNEVTPLIGNIYFPQWINKQNNTFDEKTFKDSTAYKAADSNH